MKGKIVLIPFPYTDLTSSKLRPALVLYEGEKDVIVAFVSSRIQFGSVETAVIIKKDQAGFEETGLKADSIIRLDKVATILKDLVVGELGELNEELRRSVNKKLKNIMEI